MESVIEEKPSTTAIVLPAVPALPPAADLDLIATRAQRTANSIVINSPAMYSIAVEELQSLQSKLDQLTEKRFTITRPMDAAKKAVMDLFKGPTEKCEQAIATLKAAMLTFQTEEKKKALELQRIADETARQERLRMEAESREREAEAQRQAQIAEQARIEAQEAERKAVHAAATGDAEAAEKARKEIAAAQEKEAAAAEESQQAAIASHAAAQTAMVIAPQHIASAAPKIAGVSVTEKWVAEVADKLAFIKFVAANPQYIECLDVNLTPLHQQAKSLKLNMRIDGIKAVTVSNITSRRK